MDGGAWWAAVHGVAKSDTTERLHFHFSLARIGEGNGNPLQCSCLENPRDGAAWWAAVYGVAQSWTRLKRLSSSNTQWLAGAGAQRPSLPSSSLLYTSDGPSQVQSSLQAETSVVTKGSSPSPSTESFFLYHLEVLI